MRPTCPTCRAAPAALVECDACEERFDPFVTAGACTRCALVWDALTCAACDRRTHLETWLPDGVERRAFLERLLGPDHAWVDALRKTSRALSRDISQLFIPETLEPSDPGPLRAAILKAEAAQEAAALDRTRRVAEQRHRRLLDRKRTPPVEPAAPVPIEPNPPPAAACPSCGWRPDGYPRWKCSRCDVPYDAFTPKARCCARRHVQTCCPTCEAWAPMAEWRRAGGATEELAEQPVEQIDPEEARPSPLRWLASQVASAFDRSDPRQETIAGSVERAAGATDRAFDQVSGWFASLQDEGVGIARLRARDWRGAADECTRTLRTKPDHALALVIRGVARLRLEEDRGAHADLDAALKLEGLSTELRAWALTCRARAKQQVSDFTGAIADSTAAIQLNPKTLQGHFYRSVARLNGGQLVEAVSDLNEEVRLATPELATVAVVLRSAIQVLRCEWAAADADATDALARGYPIPRLVYSFRASCRVRLGRFEEARADAARALRLAPDEGDGFLIRAKLRASTGDAKGALEDLARHRRYDPWGDRSSDWIVLAIEAHVRGERDRAVALLRRANAFASAPEYPAMWLALLLGVDDPFPAPRPGWGGDLARLARGELALDALLERAARTGLERRRTPADRLCEAHAYAGLLAERDGRQADALRAYQSCLDTGVRWFAESLWAGLRLAGVAPGVAASTRSPGPVAPPAPTPPPVLSLADQLERLARLRDQGVLTPDEFVLAKRRILGL